MAFTLAPALPQTFFDGTTLAASYKLFVYQAGTTTKVTTYQDSAGSSANTNPIILDSAGRATIFLDNSVSSSAVKFVLAPSTDTDPPTSPVWTRESVSPIPDLETELVVPGTAGENLAAGDCVYLSAGDGSRTAGRWYKTDADNDYASSTADAIGFTPSAITSGSSGDILRAGRLTGLSGLTAGTLYFVSATAGAITSSAPANKRGVGVADSTTSLIVGQENPPNTWSNLPDASASTEGIVTTGAQTFAGAKTFNGNVTFGGTQTGVPTYARCTATLTKNANTTLENVTGLAFSVGANEVWAFQFYCRWESATAADSKWALTGPGSPTSVWYGLSGQPGYAFALAATAFGTALRADPGSADQRSIGLWGLLRNGANAGTVQLQFAQQTSDASDSKVYEDSYVLAWRIS